MNQDKQPQQFATQSLDLAAWLWTNGFTPEAVPSTDPRKVDFVFDSSPELDAAVVTFLKGEAKVNPASFELLKTQLHRKIRAVRGQS
jgi:hypothetical protein